MTNRVRFNSTDNTRLAGIWYLPSKPTKRVVILTHGISVDKDEEGAFISFSKRLSENGYASFRFDFRGHGESEGKSEEMTIQGELNDLIAALHVVRKKGYTNIGVLGSSFGAGIAALVIAHNNQKIKCLCLWNPVLNYDHCFLSPTLPWLKDHHERMKKELDSQGWTILPVSSSFRVGKQLFDEMKRFAPYQALSKITIPACIIHGDKDTYVPYADSVRYVHILPHGRLTTINGGDHGLHGNETVAQQTDLATLQFFKKYL